MRIINKAFLKKIIMAFGAQGISVVISAFISLVLPETLGVGRYSYWRLFMFFVGYVGFFHFGFNDGVHLRLGGKKYEELDYVQLGTQLKILVCIQIFISVILISGAYCLMWNTERRFVFIMAALYLIISNVSLFLGYVFQAVDRTDTFSVSVMVDKGSVLVFVLLFLLVKTNDYTPFICGFTIAKVISLLYLIIKGRKIVFVKAAEIKVAAKDMWVSTSAGVKLMLTNITSTFILGIGQLVIDNVWGIESFGKISLSLSLTNFVMLFVHQISMVLFPMLCRVDKHQLENFYRTTRMLLGCILPIVFVLYIPMKSILSLILPQYGESLRYLALLIPLCTFDGKVQMLSNTYLKVLRKESKLLLFNGIGVGTSVCLSLLFGYCLDSFYGVVISMVAATAIRSIVTDIYLSRLLNVPIVRELIKEIGLVIVFVVSAWYCRPLVCFFMVVVTYAFYLWTNKRVIDWGRCLFGRYVSAEKS